MEAQGPQLSQTKRVLSLVAHVRGLKCCKITKICIKPQQTLTKGGCQRAENRYEPGAERTNQTSVRNNVKQLESSWWICSEPIWSQCPSPVSIIWRAVSYAALRSSRARNQIWSSEQMTGNLTKPDWNISKRLFLCRRFSNWATTTTFSTLEVLGKVRYWLIWISG